MGGRPARLLLRGHLPPPRRAALLAGAPQGRRKQRRGTSPGPQPLRRTDPQAQRVAVERRFPEWSPQRHMALDAIQRAVVRDLLALSRALGAALTLSEFWVISHSVKGDGIEYAYSYIDLC